MIAPRPWAATRPFCCLVGALSLAILLAGCGGAAEGAQLDTEQWEAMEARARGAEDEKARTVYSVQHKHRVRLKVGVEEGDDCSVPSATGLWYAAAWAERCAQLDGVVRKLQPPGTRERRAQMSPEERARLESLGYAGGGEDEEEEDDAASGGIENYCDCE